MANEKISEYLQESTSPTGTSRLDISEDASGTGVGPWTTKYMKWETILKLNRKVQVSDWDEYKAAITTLQGFGGGIIEFIADITVTDDVGFLNHDNIIVSGNFKTLNVTTALHLKTSGTCRFNQIGFRGENLSGANPDVNTLVVENNSATSRIFFDGCSFTGCLGRNSVLGGAAISTPVVSSSGNDFLLRLVNCEVQDAFAEGTQPSSGYSTRQFVVNGNRIFCSIYNPNGSFIYSDIPQSGAFSRRFYISALNSATCVTDGTALIQGGSSTIVVNDLNTSTNDLGINNGTLNIDYSGFDTDIFLEMDGNLTINFTDYSLTLSKSLNLYIDNPSNFTLTINYNSLTTGIKNLNTIGTTDSEINLELRCLNDKYYTGNPSGIPFLTVKQIK